MRNFAKHPSVFLYRQHRRLDTFQRRNDITQAAFTPRVPNVTGATLRGDVVADPGNHQRLECASFRDLSYGCGGRLWMCSGLLNRCTSGVLTASY